MLLPKKLTPDSKINLIHTSSPVGRADLNTFNSVLGKLSKNYLNTKTFDVQRTELDPRYLAASENERFKKLRQAIKEVDWLLPIYGGTGCADIVRLFNEADLETLVKNHPIVNGFSDTTFLINYLYFKIKLATFHYSNACGLFSADNHQLFFDILSGKSQSFSFLEPDYKWLTGSKPTEKIEGIAIGGNISTFRDLLDICDIRPKSWEPFILFIEEIELDVEDLHHLVIALDQKGIFRHIKALVVGRMNEKTYDSNFKKFNFIFGSNQQNGKNIFEYLISDEITERIQKNDPLFILKVNNFGHDVVKNTMIVPIGAKTVIYPNKKIEFQGPFVE